MVSAFGDRGTAVRVGEPFRDGLQTREDEGILSLVVAEDRALPRGNLSAAAVQWHGDAAHVGRRSLAQIMLWVQEKIAALRSQ